MNYKIILLKIVFIVGTLFLFSSCSEAIFSIYKNVFYHEPKYLIKDNKVMWVDEYSWETEVTNADKNTFKSIKGPFGKDKNFVFYYFFIIKDAEPESFDFVNVEPYEFLYKLDVTKDKYHTFFEDNIIDNADPSTFKIVNRNFWIDNKYIYFYDEMIRKFYYFENSDAKSFKFLDNYWAKDSKQVYYCQHMFIPQDVITFQPIIFSNYFYPYAKDKKAYYWGYKKIDVLIIIHLKLKQIGLILLQLINIMFFWLRNLFKVVILKHFHLVKKVATIKDFIMRLILNLQMVHHLGLQRKSH